MQLTTEIFHIIALFLLFPIDKIQLKILFLMLIMTGIILIRLILFIIIQFFIKVLLRLFIHHFRAIIKQFMFQ